MVKSIATIALAALCSGCIFSITNKELRFGLANDDVVVLQDGRTMMHQNTVGVHIKWWP